MLRWNAAVGEIRNVVTARTEEIKGLLARRHAVNIKVFGSVARGDDREDSDVDYLVDIGMLPAFSLAPSISVLGSPEPAASRIANNIGGAQVAFLGSGGRFPA